MVIMDSQLPLNHISKSPSLASVLDTSNFYPTDDNDLHPRPKVAPKIPPGFEGTVPTPKLESQGPADMNYHVRVALLEQELMNRNAQLNEVMSANAHLNQLRQDESGKVIELVQELQHCERRTAKSEIAVEYLAELNVQMAAKLKEFQNPNHQIYALKDELQSSKYDFRNKILALETEIQKIKSDKAQLTSKLEFATSTIIALSSAAILSQNAGTAKSPPQPVAIPVQHNNLIDLMDDCLAPARPTTTEDPSTTLMDEIDSKEDIDVTATAKARHAFSDSFDSDFSNSSYVIRFKDVREGARDNVTSQPICSSVRDKNITIDNEGSQRDSEHPQDSSSPIDFGTDKDSGPSGPASPPDSQNKPIANLLRTGMFPNRNDDETSAPQMHSREFLKHSDLTDEDDSDKTPLKEVPSNIRKVSGPARKTHSPNTSKSTPVKGLTGFKTKAEKSGWIRLHKKNFSHEEKTDSPAFFKYGIRFHPCTGDSEIYRTVLISNVAPGVHLGDLLNKVRGGSIFDAKSLPTNTITGYASAIVTFFEERAALAYQEYISKNAVDMSGSRLRITLLSPTWPIESQLRKKISDHRMTRCLEMCNFPKNISKGKLRADLQICPEMKTTWVTFLHLNEDGLLKVHFSSITQASHAHRMFSSNKNYAACTPYYAPDPCAEPLETLKPTESKFDRFLWDRKEIVAGESNMAYGSLKSEVKGETNAISLYESQIKIPSPICNDCQKGCSPDEEPAKPVEIEAASGAFIGGMSGKPDESSPLKHPTVENEVTELSGAERFEAYCLKVMETEIQL